MLLEKLAETSVLKYVDKLLGMAFGCIIAVIIIYVICMILPTASLLIKNEAFTQFVDGLSTAPIASLFYNDNLLARLLGNVIKL